MSMPFISDSSAKRCSRLYPEFRLTSAKTDDCITCRGKRVYNFKGDEVECECSVQKELARHYFDADVGLMYQRLDWKDFHGDVDMMNLAVTYIENAEKFIESGIGLIFGGVFGVGKTMLANLVAKDLVKAGYSVHVTTFARMIEMWTRTWGSNDEKLDFESRMISRDVLVMDDVGKEFKASSKMSETTFDYVLRQRAANARPTILTTNMTVEEMGDGYGGAILSLLTERSIAHWSEKEDWRSKSRDRLLDEVKNNWTRPIF